MKITKDDIIKALEEMKLVELNELIKTIEIHFKLQQNIGNINSKELENKIEKPVISLVDVILVQIGISKVAVIKFISQLINKGLLETKSLIEKLPVLIKSKINLEEAEELKNKLVSLGASVEIK